MTKMVTIIWINNLRNIRMSKNNILKKVCYLLRFKLINSKKKILIFKKIQKNKLLDLKK